MGRYLAIVAQTKQNASRISSMGANSTTFRGTWSIHQSLLCKSSSWIDQPFYILNDSMNNSITAILLSAVRFPPDLIPTNAPEHPKNAASAASWLQMDFTKKNLPGRRALPGGELGACDDKSSPGDSSSGGFGHRGKPGKMAGNFKTIMFGFSFCILGWMTRNIQKPYLYTYVYIYIYYIYINIKVWPWHLGLLVTHYGTVPIPKEWIIMNHPLSLKAVFPMSGQWTAKMHGRMTQVSRWPIFLVIPRWRRMKGIPIPIFGRESKILSPTIWMVQQSSVRKNAPTFVDSSSWEICSCTWSKRFIAYLKNSRTG